MYRSYPKFFMSVFGGQWKVLIRNNYLEIIMHNKNKMEHCCVQTKRKNLKWNDEKCDLTSGRMVIRFQIGR